MIVAAPIALFSTRWLYRHCAIVRCIKFDRTDGLVFPLSHDPTTLPLFEYDYASVRYLGARGEPRFKVDGTRRDPGTDDGPVRHYRRALYP